MAGYRGGSIALANASGTHEELQGVEDPPTTNVATPQPIGGLSASNPTALVTPKLADINVPTTYSSPPAAQSTPQPIAAPAPSGTIAPAPAPTPQPAPIQTTNNNVATPQPVGALSASNPMTLVTPKPPAIDVATPQPQGANSASAPTPVNATTGEAIPKQTATSATIPPGTDQNTPPSLDDRLAHLDQILTDFADGKVDDAVFKTTANRAILQMGLNNQAEMDALQMRINQDPSLKGQGAGQALMSMMTANHNFSADQMFGSLAQDAQQKILDLQKYGIQQGMAINAQRRQNALSNINLLQNAGDFSGAADALTKLIGLPGVTIDPSQFAEARARNNEDVNRMIASGDFNGAAAKSQQMGINVTADQLRVRDPYMQGIYNDQMQQAKDLVNTDPAAAEAMINGMMQNPALKDRFAPGMTAKELVNELLTGSYQKNQELIQQSNTEINAKAQQQPPVPFLQALTDYKGQPQAAWQAFENQGKSLANSDLAAFNAARTKAGLSVFGKDANGNIGTIDKDGNLVPATDEDFGETAAAADYYRRHDNQTKDPVQTAYDALYNGAFKDKILSIPGGDTMVKQALTTLYNGGGYSVDPQTGLLKGDYTSSLPWENPKTTYLYHNWPAANFNPDGSVTNGTDGKPKYDLGGEAYGDTIGGNKIQKLPDDEALDSNFQKYQYNGGDLTAPQWYFATAGGTKPVDKTKIPADVAAIAGPDLTNPGATGTGTTGTGTPSGTTTPQGQAEVVKQFSDYVTSTAGAAPDAVKSTVDNAVTMYNANKNLPTDSLGTLSVGSNTDFSDAADRLTQKGVTADQMAKIANTYMSGQIGGFGGDRHWQGTQAFGNYTIYNNLLKGGLNEDAATQAFVKLVGMQSAIQALGLEGRTLTNAEITKYDPTFIKNNLGTLGKYTPSTTTTPDANFNPYAAGSFSGAIGQGAS